MGSVTTLVHGRRDDVEQGYGAEYLELIRVIIVGGVPLGMLLGGALLRLSMLALRLTSPDSVRGLRTDDGFTVGEVTLGGTYNLVMLGGMLGIIGAAAYVLVSPWLIGDRWFRALTVAVTAGLLVGSMVIHADGIDFRVLEPTWLAVAMFVAVPAVFAFVLVYAVDAVAVPGHWTSRGHLAWAIPVGVLALVPFAALTTLFVAAAVALLLPLRRALLPRIQASPVAMTAFRAVFLVIPVLSLLALREDVTALL
jgi:hypothetical protein